MVPERRLTPVRVPRPLKKKLERKSTQSRGAILKCIRQLREDWRHPGLRTKKMKGREFEGSPVFEARVTKGDRITFFWQNERIVIENHCTHQQVLGK